MPKRLYIFFTMLVVFGGAAMFLMTITENLWGVSDTQIPIPPEAVAVDRDVELGDHPVRLRVPVLGIDAHVQEVGVTSSGNMATPNNFTDVGWYKYGTPPGFHGSAVLAGHVDNGLALPGVFKRLNELAVGDDLYVETQDGSEALFRVVEIQTYPYTHVPRDVLFARTDTARLNLVTCEGTWVSGERTYDQRLVVYTELIE